jgi:hypothetical protein
VLAIFPKAQEAHKRVQMALLGYLLNIPGQSRFLLISDVFLMANK